MYMSCASPVGLERKQPQLKSLKLSYARHHLPEGYHDTMIQPSLHTLSTHRNPEETNYAGYSQAEHVLYA